MTTTLALAISVAMFGNAEPARSAETSAKSKIVSVALFKNGLAVVKRQVTLGKSGVYVLDDVPNPIHGTYWIESAAPVETVVKMRDMEFPANEMPPGNLQEDLAGKQVTIYLKGDKLPPIVGTMLKIKQPKPVSAARYGPRAALEFPTNRFLVVETKKGRSYLELSEVAYIETENAPTVVKRQQPCLLLTLGATEKPETRVTISYLTRGIGWAPSYKIDITDPKTLNLEQQAIVKNELANLEDVDMKLISGFPSVQFARVTSPMSARSSWAEFFQELNQHDRSDSGLTGNSVLLNQSAMNFVAPVMLGLGATPAGEGVDLYYQSIGRRSLEEDASLSLTVAKGKSPYDRVVEWVVPDSRDELGRQNRERGPGEDPDDGPWDALKFKNPLAFPMTTGPAMVVADGKFNGQRTSFWVNVGEETVLRVDKALSIRTRSTENEEQKNGNDGREFVWVGGRQFRKAVVEGELTLSNHRAETVNMVIRRRFSGELLNAEGTPKASLLADGISSVNRRNELVWTLPLTAGEERKLKYRFAVLVLN